VDSPTSGTPARKSNPAPEQSAEGFRPQIRNPGLATAASLPNFAKAAYARDMGTMNISLPDALKDFVDDQVKRGYGTSSEYVRELIRKDQERLHLRELLLAGAASKPAAPVDRAYFKRLRGRVRAARTGGARR
jgi:antitoxin ParD1/3/4